MFLKNQNYQRFAPASQKGFFSLKKILFISLIIIILGLFIMRAMTKRTIKKTIEEIESKKAQIQTSINTIENDIQSTKKEISDLKSKSSELKSTLEKTKEEQKKNLNADSQKSDEKSSLSEKKSKLEKELTDTDSQIKDLKESNEKIEKENDDKEKKIKELKEKIEEINKKKRTSTLVDSIILSNTNVESLGALFDKKINLNLLYRASQDGKEVETFYEKVGSHKNIIIIGKTSDNEILGGYTTKSLEGDGFKKDKYAFLINLNQGKIYNVDNSDEALLLKKDAFPCFGNGDLTFEVNKVQSKFPKSYEGNKKLELTDGKIEITFVDIEVFYLTVKK